MQSKRTPRAAAIAVMAFLLMSCEPGGSLIETGRADDYQVARQALETGNYPLAITRYERLLVTAGDAAGRLQLEYAHSLLRGARYDDAINIATKLIDKHNGSLQASALAVRGTAQHQIVRVKLASGEADTTLRSRLLAAQSDLQSFVKEYPKLDAASAMKSRLEMIAADLKKVG